MIPPLLHDPKELQEMMLLLCTNTYIIISAQPILLYFFTMVKPKESERFPSMHGSNPRVRSRGLLAHTKLPLDPVGM
jgi:hypothetical protein